MYFHSEKNKRVEMGVESSYGVLMAGRAAV